MLYLHFSAGLWRSTAGGSKVRRQDWWWRWGHWSRLTLCCLISSSGEVDQTDCCGHHRSPAAHWSGCGHRGHVRVPLPETEPTHLLTLTGHSGHFFLPAFQHVCCFFSQLSRSWSANVFIFLFYFLFLYSLSLFYNLFFLLKWINCINNSIWNLHLCLLGKWLQSSRCHVKSRPSNFYVRSIFHFPFSLSLVCLLSIF